MNGLSEENAYKKIVKTYLIIVSSVFSLFVLFKLFFDFNMPTWLALILPTLFLIPLILLLLGLRTGIVVNFNLSLIVIYMQLVLSTQPTIFHVLVYWCGIIPIMIVPLLGSKSIRIWGVIFLLLIIFNGLVISHNTGPYTLELDPFKFMGAGIIYWMVTFSTLSIFDYVQRRNSDKLKSHNSELTRLKLEIEKQNDLLKSQHEEIKSINEELKTTNDHLEERIQQRTKDLEIRNEQLKEYAFINSHILRAPVARIIGLINLVKLSSYSLDHHEEILHLDKAGEELDGIVGEINKAIDEDTSLHRRSFSDPKLL